MRLSQHQVEKVSEMVLERLVKHGVLPSVARTEAILSRIRMTISEDFRAEDTLDEEVRKILQAHRKEIDSGKVDYAKMFQMVKKRLAEERGIIL